MKKNEKGQALVEFSLVITIFVITFLMALDPMILKVNQSIARYGGFRIARQVSIYRAGNETCAQSISGMSNIPFFGAISSTVVISPSCSTDPGWTSPTGEKVTVVISWSQARIFWNAGEIFNQSITVTDIFQ